MENAKKQVEVGIGDSSSASCFAMDLFGPKDSSSASPSSTSGLFGSVFGPASTGLGRDSCHGSFKKHDLGSQFVHDKHGTPGSNYMAQKNRGEGGGIPNKERGAEPCYFSSSIYYGGQEIYCPDSQTTVSHYKKDGQDDDLNVSNLNSASRGNWWQGSLYY